MLGGRIGFGEILLLLVIALVVFGPAKLPELGRSIGRGLAEFRKATQDLKSTFEEAAMGPMPAPPVAVPPQAAGAASAVEPRQPAPPVAPSPPEGDRSGL